MTQLKTLSFASHQLMSHGQEDVEFMRAALDQALLAQSEGEVPVGAVVVFDGKIVGRGRNCNISQADPTAHAEMVALREAAKFLQNHRLNECSLFVTIEPCAMCAGALVHSRLRRLIYGAADAKAGAVNSVIQVLNHPLFNHQMEVVSGVLEEECAALVQNFFRQRRSQMTPPK